AAAVAARAVALQWTTVEDPFNPHLFANFAVASAALIALAAGLISGATRVRVERRAIARIAGSLSEAPTPGTLQPARAGALPDPGLQIASWPPGAHRYANAAGRAVAEPVAGPGRMVTYLTRDGRRIAAVAHGGTGPGLESHLGPAIVLGLE